MSESSLASSPVRAGSKKEVKEKAQSSLFAPRIKPFKKKELVQMFRSLASMLRAQISTADAIKYYAHGHRNKILVSTLNEIYSDVNKGVPIHAAFRRSEKFDDMTIGLIQAGGDTGQLDTAFAELGKRIKSDMHFRKKIRKLIMMPCIVIPILMGAFIAITGQDCSPSRNHDGRNGGKGTGEAILSGKPYCAGNMADCCIISSGNGNYHLEVDSD